MDKVATIASQSSTDGQQTVTVLTSPGLDAAAIVKRLNNIAGREQQNVVAAQELSPPGKLRLEHGNLIQSLAAPREWRQRAREGVREDHRLEVEDRHRGGRAEPAGLPAARERRHLGRPLQDAVRAGARGRGCPRRDGARVPLPARAGPGRLAACDGADPQPHRLGRRRRLDAGRPPRHEHRLDLRASRTGRAAPARCCRPGTLNTVTTSSSLVFQVTIHNGGDSQEVQIPVTLTIGRPASQGGPITKTEKVQLIDPGTDQSVTFSDLGQVPFASQTTVSVDVAKVPGRGQYLEQLRLLPGHLLASVVGMQLSGNAAAAVAVVGVVLGAAGVVARLASPGRGSGGCATPSARSSAAAGRTSSSSRSRCRPASTTSTAPSTRSPAGLARVDRRVDDDGRQHRDRPLRRLRGHRRPPVRLARAARRDPHAAS